MKAVSRVIILVMLSLVLFGCVYTPVDLVQKKLVVEYYSDKEPRIVAGCIGDLWLKDYGNVSTVQTGTGYMVVRGSVTGSYGADAAVLIEHEGEGSRVKYGEQLYWDPENMAQSVRNCK